MDNKILQKERNNNRRIWGAHTVGKCSKGNIVTFDPFRFRSKFEAHIRKSLTAYVQTQNSSVSAMKYKTLYLSNDETFLIKEA